MNSFNLKIATKAYSEREAWAFLQVHGPELNISIRNLSLLWKWHRSKVERFIKFLRSETLIETKTSQGKNTIITLINKGVDKLHHSLTSKTISRHLTRQIFKKSTLKINPETFLRQEIRRLNVKKSKALKKLTRQNRDGFKTVYLSKKKRKKEAKKEKKK